MEELIVQRKFKESWDLVVDELENDPENREELKELFTFILLTYCAELQAQLKDVSALHCYETALKFYPKDSDILNELGSFFSKHDRDDEAKAFFEKSFENNQRNLKAYQNLQNVKNKMARWHFRMLNDSGRNLAFKKAIQYWIRHENKVDVIDIGSGTGLLSMYAANVANVKSIYAIEFSSIMSQISKEVFKENVRGKIVKLISKHSMDLDVGEGNDLPAKASLIVSETLDAGVFGEGVLDTLIHAKQCLLRPDGKIVPWKVKIHVAGYKSMNLCTNQILMNDTLQEYLFLDNLRLVAKREEPYDAEYVDRFTDFKLVTTTADTLEVDFNNLESMEKHFDGTVVKDFVIESTVVNDFIDGFVIWFTLYLSESNPENTISTQPKSGSCWNQAIFKLNERVLLEKDQVLELKVSCKDGILKIHHDIDENLEIVEVEVNPDVLKFLNDEDYLRELEFSVSKHDHKFINCLDLSPFPYVGMMLLKDSRLEKLWCRKRDEEFIKKIAEKNVIDESKFVFIDESEADLKTTFELIILHPFHALGDLDSEVICRYPKYKEQLTATGLMIPCKVSIYGELINSDWLIDCCRITEVGVKRLKIDKFINQYATEIHLDLDSSLDCERLSSVFRISELHLDENYHETSINVQMKNINLPVHAILFHCLIQLSSKVPEFTTNRKSQTSYFKRSAQVLAAELLVTSATVKVTFNQNTGIVKCDVIS